MPAGRPTLYNDNILLMAQNYLDMLPEDEVVHSIEGLSCYLHVARETIRDWASQESKPEFSAIVKEVLAMQSKRLVNRGLDGSFNNSITKLMLTKHGYRDEIATDITTGGEKVNGSSAEAIALAKEYEDRLKQSLSKPLPVIAAAPDVIPAQTGAIVDAVLDQNPSAAQT